MRSLSCWRQSALDLFLLTAVIIGGSALAFASSKTLAPEVVSAKSIFVDNQTGNPDVLEFAKKKFAEWGRFSLATSEQDADLRIVFSHQLGLDYMGNASFIVMDVFIKGTDLPAYHTKNAFKVLGKPRLRTDICISNFQKRLEPKR